MTPTNYQPKTWTTHTVWGDVDGPLRTTTDKLIFWIDIQMRELAKQDLYKGGMNAGYAIAITLIKQKLEDGEFD